MPKSNKLKKDKKDYEELGKIVANIYETGYLDKAESYKNSFTKGIIGGVGGVLGATVVIAILLWVLSLFGQVPLIGHFVEKTRQTIEHPVVK